MLEKNSNQNVLLCLNRKACFFRYDAFWNYIENKYGGTVPLSSSSVVICIITLPTNRTECEHPPLLWTWVVTIKLLEFGLLILLYIAPDKHTHTVYRLKPLGLGAKTGQFITKQSHRSQTKNPFPAIYILPDNPLLDQ